MGLKTVKNMYRTDEIILHQQPFRIEIPKKILGDISVGPMSSGKKGLKKRDVKSGKKRSDEYEL